ncbi:MAG: GGDEF domain-containing protein [Armatimonadota bacterium]
MIPESVNYIKSRVSVRPLVRITGLLVRAAGFYLIAAFALSGYIDAVVAALSIIAFIAGGIRVSLGSPSNTRKVEIDAGSAVVIGAALACGPVSAAGPAAMAALGSILLDFNHRDSLANSTYTVARMPISAALASLVFGWAGGNTVYTAGAESLPAALAAAAAYIVLDSALAGSIRLVKTRWISAGLGYGLGCAARTMPPFVMLAVILPAALAVLGLLRDARRNSKIESEPKAEEDESPTEVAKTSFTDPLTGLANQRYLEMFLRQEISRAERSGHPISVILIDIDNFEQLNELDGRESADRCLVAIGAGVKRMLREYDVIARYKDDEFVVVLPECDITAAHDAAARLHAALSGQVLPLRAHFSAGVATYPAYGTSIDDLLSSAHHALNRAKFAGKNTIRSCHELAKAG